MSDAMEELERKLRQTKTALRRQITENQKIKDDEKTRITTLNQNLIQSQNTIDDLNQNLIQSQNTIDDLQKQIHTLQEQIQQFSNTNEGKLNQRLNNLKMKYKKANEENEKNDDEIDKLKNKILEMERTNKTRRNELENKNKELQEDLDWFKKQDEMMTENYVEEKNECHHYSKLFATWVIAFRNLNKKLSETVKHSEPPLTEAEECTVSYWKPYVEDIEMYLFKENPFIIKQS